MAYHTTVIIFTVSYVLRASVGDGQIGKQAGTLLVPAFSNKPTNCECGKISRKIDYELLGKVKVSGGRIPWLAELITKNEHDGKDYRTFCFGTVISLRTVLFPASCIDKWSTTIPKVKLWGMEELKFSKMKVSSFTLHPGYRGKFDNDIALVKLASVIDSNKTGVVPICLQQVSRNFAHPPHLLLRNSIERENGTKFEINVDMNNSSSSRLPCKNPNLQNCPEQVQLFKQNFTLEFMVTRSWFFKKAPGYDNIQKFGRFNVLKEADNQCRILYPEMLQTKLVCMQHKILKDVQKHREKFFSQLELGMAMMTVNTTGKGKQKEVRYYLDSMRAPGHGGIPLLPTRENLIPLLKIHDYIPWVRANTYVEHFCRN